MIRRLRAWRRVTTPPALMPMVVLGTVGLILAAVAVDALGGTIGFVAMLITGWDEDDDVSIVSIALLLLVDYVLLAGLWWLMKRMVAGWVRAQPPDPPRQ